MVIKLLFSTRDRTVHALSAKLEMHMPYIIVAVTSEKKRLLEHDSRIPPFTFLSSFSCLLKKIPILSTDSRSFKNRRQNEMRSDKTRKNRFAYTHTHTQIYMYTQYRRITAYIRVCQAF